MLRLIRIWLVVVSRAAQDEVLNLGGAILFLIGKCARFGLYFVLLFTVLKEAGTLAGYTQTQVIFFLLVFNLIDILVQSLFRGVYHFRSLVINGDFDLDLLKPLPTFFRPLFGWADIIDLITLIPLMGFFSWFVASNHLISSFWHTLLFAFLLVNSLILAFSLHLMVCAVGLITMEVDHLVWIYRDIQNLARLPTDIYPVGMRAVLTVIVPVIILITVPAKAFLGLLNWSGVVGSLMVTGLFLLVSWRFWNFALTKYSSASS